ncbi:MAG TPA: Spy/CpxP family protein refolding chaperone [Phycisphaeraceae bacterium]
MWNGTARMMAAGVLLAGLIGGTALADQDKPRRHADDHDRPTAAQHDHGRHDKDHDKHHDKGKDHAKDKPGAAASQPDRDRAAQRQRIEQRIHEHLFGNLNLTDEQEGQIKQVLDDFRQKRKAWWEEHRDDLRNLREQLGQARQDQDEERLDQLRQQLRELIQSAPKPSDVHEPIKATLNAQQQEQFEENLKTLREKLREMHDRGQRPHDGEKREGQGASTQPATQPSGKAGHDHAVYRKNAGRKDKLDL